MTPIFPAKLDLANQLITMDKPSGEVFNLILNRDAAIWIQELPQRVQVGIGRATKIKSRPYENYYWGYIVPIMVKHFGELFPEDAHALAVTESEAHRKVVYKVAERDRFGNPITTSDQEFDLWKQMAYIETVRQWLALKGIFTIDPDPNWRDNLKETR